MLSVEWLKELRMFDLHLKVTRQVVTAFMYLTKCTQEIQMGKKNSNYYKLP